MMVKRKKSIEQIREQVSRIFRNGNLTGSRWARAESAGNRYIRNIASMKRFAKDYKGGGVESARKRAYSSTSYMYGNNIG